MASEWWEARLAKETTIIGVPSALGIRPYDDGGVRGVERAPAVLRGYGVVQALGARDAGDILPAPYRDHRKPDGRPRNDVEVVHLCEALADRVAEIHRASAFPVVVAGDCSVVLGALSGLRRAGMARPGLVYIDGHADFASPDESRTGSVASMCLGLAVGRAPQALAPLTAASALVRAEDVVLVGRRDQNEGGYGHAALHASQVLDLPDAAVRAAGDYETVADTILTRVGAADIDGFWIHVDADVLPADVMPAVDSPQPGGPHLGELATLVRRLAAHPRACGLELTIYDPALDPDGTCARRLIALLAVALPPAAADRTGPRP